jgi:hypothetical protein
MAAPMGQRPVKSVHFYAIMANEWDVVLIAVRTLHSSRRSGRNSFGLYILYRLFSLTHFLLLNENNANTLGALTYYSYRTCL